MSQFTTMQIVTIESAAAQLRASVRFYQEDNNSRAYVTLSNADGGKSIGYLRIDDGIGGSIITQHPIPGKNLCRKILKNLYRSLDDLEWRVSYAVDNWRNIQRAKSSRPYLRYSAILDDRTRPEHAAWHGTVLPADDPWWDTHYPPNGWDCRCTVIQLSERDLDREGWSVGAAPPRGDTTIWRNPCSGETIEVPAGIDPGFDCNVGKLAPPA